MHYLLLAGIGLAMLALSLLQPNRRIKAGLFVATAASINFVDILLVVFLHRYAYRPGLLTNPLLDNYLGELLAEFIFVPCLAAVVLGGLPARRRLLGAPVVAIIFTLIELWLVKTGEFIQLHWSEWFTLVLFTLFALVVGYGANRFEQVGYTPAIRVLLSIAATVTLWAFWTMLTSAIGRLWGIRFDLLRDPEDDLGLGLLLLHALPFVVAVQGALRVRWLGSLLGMTALAVGFALLFYGITALGLWAMGGPGSQLLQAVSLTLLVLLLRGWDRWLQRFSPAAGSASP